MLKYSSLHQSFFCSLSHSHAPVLEVWISALKRLFSCIKFSSANFLSLISCRVPIILVGEPCSSYSNIWPLSNTHTQWPSLCRIRCSQWYLLILALIKSAICCRLLAMSSGWQRSIKVCGEDVSNSSDV